MKPEIINGVPEEPGYYYGMGPDDDKWTLVHVLFDGGEPVMAEHFGKELASPINAEKIIWSERIEPPYNE